jgi:short-subunit dehydrogenase
MRSLPVVCAQVAGAIVKASSLAGQRSVPSLGAYSASKSHFKEFL